jgi:hypothetical protein
LIIVYDDADKLGFGTAYISDEAYESPLSVLKFGTATIEPATRAEFVDFRKNGTPNLVSRASYFGIQSDDSLKRRGLERVWPPFGLICHAYRRFRIPDALRSNIREQWPTGRPTYWRPANDDKGRELVGLIWRSQLQRDDGIGEPRSSTMYSGNEYMGDQGVANRHGSGTIRPEGYAPSFYPVSNGISANKWQTRPGGDASLLANVSEVIVNQVDMLNGATRGFAYCYADPGLVIHGPLAERLDREIDLVRRVDDEPIYGGAKSWRGTSFNLHSFFERDEYYFRALEFFIDSVRGDV